MDWHACKRVLPVPRAVNAEATLPGPPPCASAWRPGGWRAPASLSLLPPFSPSYTTFPPHGHQETVRPLVPSCSPSLLTASPAKVTIPQPRCICTSRRHIPRRESSGPLRPPSSPVLTEIPLLASTIVNLILLQGAARSSLPLAHRVLTRVLLQRGRSSQQTSCHVRTPRHQVRPRTRATRACLTSSKQCQRRPHASPTRRARQACAPQVLRHSREPPA